MIVTGNRQQVRQLHVNSFTDGTGIYSRSGNIMTCTGAGTAYIPHKFSRGTFEWDFKKVGGGTDLRVNFISTTSINYTGSQGYGLWLESNESFYLVKMNNGVTILSTSTTPSILINTDYSVRVEVSNVNSFKRYIKGGVYTEWTLIPGISNPFIDTSYTDTNYFVVDMDAGDVIWNITYKPY